ncbi:hypothetical protein E2C06_13275 [Dankookia rubra]|uniref:Uncharacterized protein n=1 Tax=Dankookia rubra TaxID=1442381 RepID=A0A4R5QFW0_9PROT|nr:hypothetical protein [Dankookia rubra]TDH62140.1 hypothetical protein E2C06_13275 [Dankookia rubra]
MSDLFDRVAAQALGLPSALRPRPRSRFEPETVDERGFSTDPPHAEAHDLDGPGTAEPGTGLPDAVGVTAVPAVQVAADAAAATQHGPTGAPPAVRVQDLRAVALPVVGAKTGAAPEHGSRHPDSAPERASAGEGSKHPLMAQDEAPDLRQAPSMTLPGDSPLSNADVGRSLVPSTPVRPTAGLAAPARQAVRQDPPGGPHGAAIAPPTRAETRYSGVAESAPGDRSAEPPRPVPSLPPGAPVVAPASHFALPPGRAAASLPGRDEAAPRSPDALPQAALPSAVEITIGRLEIRADPAPAARPAKLLAPHLNLAAWRAQRERDG